MGCRHDTHKIEPGTASDIMLPYGVTFETLEGETAKPGDVPGEPTTPAGPGVDPASSSNSAGIR